MIRTVHPQPLLRPFIRSFRFRESVVTESLRFPIPARPVQFMEFYLRDRYQVIDFASEVVTTAPSVVVLGQQTRRLSDLHLQGNYAVFTINFQPTGFHRLFGVSMSELSDTAIPADAILGDSVNALQEQLAHAGSLVERVELTERFLLPKVMKATSFPPIVWAADSILCGHGRVSLDALRRESGLGLRQFERQFDRYVGVTPKRFARIARFQRAVTLGRLYGEGNWTRIAAEAGYFDQMHLIKDFWELSGQTPTLLHQAVRATESWNPLRALDKE